MSTGEDVPPTRGASPSARPSSFGMGWMKGASNKMASAFSLEQMGKGITVAASATAQGLATATSRTRELSTKLATGTPDALGKMGLKESGEWIKKSTQKAAEATVAGAAGLGKNIATAMHMSARREDKGAVRAEGRPACLLGSSLEAVAIQDARRPVPRAVVTCVMWLAAAGTTQEGVFVQDGDPRSLGHLAAVLEGGGRGVLPPEGISPLTVASFLKRLLAELPEPLLTYQLYHAFIRAGREGADPARLAALVARLPTIDQAVLELLCQLLGRCAAQEAVNRTGTARLACALAPALLRSPPLEEATLGAGAGAEAGVGAEAEVEAGAGSEAGAGVDEGGRGGGADSAGDPLDVDGAAERGEGSNEGAALDTQGAEAPGEPGSGDDDMGNFSLGDEDDEDDSGTTDAAAAEGGAAAPGPANPPPQGGPPPPPGGADARPPDARGGGSAGPGGSDSGGSGDPKQQHDDGAGLGPPESHGPDAAAVVAALVEHFDAIFGHVTAELFSLDDL